MYLKLNTATSSEKIEKADAYKEAISFSSVWINRTLFQPSKKPFVPIIIF